MEIKHQFSKKICPRHPIQRYLLAKKSLVFYLFMSLHKKISELKGKSHEPSKNSSARAPARARSAGAHHYKLYILWMTNQLITSSQDESLKLKWWLMLFIPNLRVQQLMQSDGGIFFSSVSFLHFPGSVQWPHFVVDKHETPNLHHFCTFQHTQGHLNSI